MDNISKFIWFIIFNIESNEQQQTQNQFINWNLEMKSLTKFKNKNFIRIWNKILGDEMYMVIFNKMVGLLQFAARFGII